ncbi:protein kinase domain-containing protein [Baaleninema sp.]|uniref:serine/threonine-protein kinase n=1 Tax=Baaleninema sp. TaxID=3101197 RepID=UPI003D06927E
MRYCVNPACPSPENPDSNEQCLSCGSTLLLNGRYCAIKVLGQGGFGATFAARNVALPGNPICAIKQLRVASNNPNAIERARLLFEREATTLGKIGNHPQVPTLLDYFELDGQFYLVQEYVKGMTLKQEVKRFGCFDEFQVRAVLDEVLVLLKYFQSQTVIHRDIKPANIIRRSLDNRLVAIDFGAVKDEVSHTAILDPDDPTPNTSFAIGTPGFAPPEQMAMHPVYASDIYALAATCLYLLTGKSPRRLGYDPLTGSICWRDRVQVSDNLAYVLDKMLQPVLAQRYQSAEEVLADLHYQPIAEETVEVAPQTTATPTPTVEPVEEVTQQPPEKQETTYFGSTEPLDATNLTDTRLHRSKRRSFRSRMGDRTTASSSNRSQGSSRRSQGGKLTAEELKTDYFKGRRDFANRNLSGADLQRFNLEGANFNESKLVKTNLRGANLHKADLSQTGMNHAVLRDADLSDAFMSYCNLAGADLRGADLTNAYLTYANLTGANLCGANLTNAKVTQEQLASAKTNWRTILPDGKRGLFS